MPDPPEPPAKDVAEPPPPAAPPPPPPKYEILNHHWQFTAVEPAATCACYTLRTCCTYRACCASGSPTTGYAILMAVIV